MQVKRKASSDSETRDFHSPLLFVAGIILRHTGVLAAIDGNIGFDIADFIVFLIAILPGGDSGGARNAGKLAPRQCDERIHTDGGRLDGCIRYRGISGVSSPFFCSTA